ncbi:hypothetical protein COCC4DRAFT_192619 [Bipolaris maydis ATCC 48331]|uniref:Phytanoyl-CoA hydroxylase n=2 Tax=Cochliobolus heterostrophus TaxID=5016 RepID=M2TLR9_COCH5|nr:uncharacterized protein COCC4DRAFT_192619 [Bipolaris maydis ATCC 48331]EMD87449.1 hypothetical protein COCHEDRAFT_1145101 [Bipolaris maydis C5]ENI06649.1 hypothetical protein COCC4DRAFT_192619 [Bipolaris maydis ATCC 48331]KAJ6212145.1 hypothetical protein PSV09DRAFT_1145101 [Bipolaris maydis]
MQHPTIFCGHHDNAPRRPPIPTPIPPSLQGHHLYVNDGLLHPTQVSRLRPSSPTLPLDELRRRYQEDGYLFLKALLPRADVLRARESYFRMLAPSGVLKPSTPPVLGQFDSSKPSSSYPGIGAGATPNNGKPGADATASLFVDLALQAHYAPWYKDEFCKHPALRDFVAELTGWGPDTLSVKRSLLRNNTPGNKAIGVHYDQIFLRKGEDTSVTAWVPMGDISLTGGGLIYLENGHHLGREIEEEFTRRARESGLTEEETKNAFNKNMMSNGLLADGPKEYSETFGRRWLVTDYEAGDVVLHTPYTIHASTMNYDSNDIIRVGTDLRFVNASKPWDKRWDKDYEFDDGV